MLLQKLDDSPLFMQTSIRQYAATGYGNSYTFVPFNFQTKELLKVWG